MLVRVPEFSTADGRWQTLLHQLSKSRIPIPWASMLDTFELANNTRTNSFNARDSIGSTIFETTLQYAPDGAISVLQSRRWLHSGARMTKSIVQKMHAVQASHDSGNYGSVYGILLGDEFCRAEFCDVDARQTASAFLEGDTMSRPSLALTSSRASSDTRMTVQCVEENMNLLSDGNDIDTLSIGTHKGTICDSPNAPPSR
jgi:hypothetical protein